MYNELDLYFPHIDCNGEDCIIIPRNQITNVEITMPSTIRRSFIAKRGQKIIQIDDIGCPEMVLTVRYKNRGKNNDYR